MLYANKLNEMLKKQIKQRKLKNYFESNAVKEMDNSFHNNLIKELDVIKPRLIALFSLLRTAKKDTNLFNKIVVELEGDKEVPYSHQNPIIYTGYGLELIMGFTRLSICDLEEEYREKTREKYYYKYGSEYLSYLSRDKLKIKNDTQRYVKEKWIEQFSNPQYNSIVVSVRSNEELGIHTINYESQIGYKGNVITYLGRYCRGNDFLDFTKEKMTTAQKYEYAKKYETMMIRDFIKAFPKYEKRVLNFFEKEIKGKRQLLTKREKEIILV